MRRHRLQRTGPSRQRGMALLVAVLLVALGTMVAATLGYDSAMAFRRTTTSYAFDESILIAQGAESLAAYALKQVYQSSRGSNRTTNASQAWAQPFGPVEVVPGAMLDAQLEDLQGRFNINSLVVADSNGNLVPDPEARHAFELLLGSVNVEPYWAGFIIDWIDPDIQPQTPEGAEDSVYLGQNPPYLAPNKYITSITELLALPGFGRGRYDKIAPFITALPPGVKINVCTAAPEVLDAFLNGNREFSTDRDGFLKNRQSAGGCYPSLNDYQTAYTHANPTTNPNGANGAGVSNGSPANGANLPSTGLAGHFQVTSDYFRLTSHMVFESTAEFNVYSLLYQDETQGAVRPILRSYTPD